VASANTCTYTTADSTIFAQTVIAAAMYLADVGGKKLGGVEIS
jgi:hypothetical protein